MTDQRPHEPRPAAGQGPLAADRGDQVPDLYVVARPNPADPAAVRSSWVEVIPLSGGRVVLSAGVVEAAGPQAREVTDLLRTAGRDCAERDLPPTQALASLDGTLRSAPIGAEVTAAHAVHDRDARSLAVANAGRWPPAIVSPRGSTALVSTVFGPPLGAGARADTSVSIPFPLGSSLVLCLHAVMACLAGRILEELLVTQIGAARLATRGRPSLGQVCDVLVSAVHCGNADHGTTVVIAQARSDDDPDNAVRSFPPRPASAAAARAFTLQTMDEWHLGEKANRAAAIVGELTANAIQHTASPFEVGLHRSPAAVLLEVTDRDTHLPDPSQAGPFDAGRRGLPIVEALADGWGTRFIEGGKVVWAELQLSPRPHDAGLDPPS